MNNLGLSHSRRRRAQALRPGRRPTVLLTGFDPFDGARRNASWDAVRPLHRRTLAGHRIVCACLPTVFGAALHALAALRRRHRPALTLCVGEAAERRVVSLEALARNWQQARIADNAGVRPHGQPVLPRAPRRRASALPLHRMRRALRRRGLPAELSRDAGAFVCNHVFYGLLHARPPGERAGFIHLPAKPCWLAPARASEALRIALRAALQPGPDHYNLRRVGCS